MYTYHTPQLDIRYEDRERCKFLQPKYKFTYMYVFVLTKP